MKFYKVIEQDDMSEKYTNWFTNKIEAKKYCNKLNKDVKKENLGNFDISYEDIMLVVDEVEIPTNKKELLRWLNNYAERI